MASSLSKMLAVLQLFNEGQAAWTADAICERLKLSTSSGYRYIRELTSVGLLNRLTGGLYVLGPLVIELEYVMRVSDPVGQAGVPILERLAKDTGCDALLSNLSGLHLINVLHVRGMEDLDISYTRGKLHPLFRGAVAKAVLPFMRRTQLVKIYEAHRQEIADNGLGATWLEFWRHLQTIARKGYSESRGELDPGLFGLGVPVIVDGSVVGSVTLVYSGARAKVLNQEGLLEHMHRASAELSEALVMLSSSDGQAQ